MKANHISAERRLANRISKLEIRLDESFVRIRKRFYPYCKYCDKTNIEVSMNGHSSYCPIKGIDKEIKYYKDLLDKLKTRKEDNHGI